MSGIVGIFSLDGPPPHRERWPELVNHLRHRGPDEGAWWADGPFFFGHRRLCILDIEGGGQPMATEDGALVVTFDGAIYNFEELRAELEEKGHSFRTNSDTEVLLHGYRAWGDELPSRLIGMFAFAIADRRREELFLARGRFGQKPLFIIETQEYVAFASEVRPLAALPDIPRAMNAEALGGYLCRNFVPGTAALFDGIERLPAATWKVFTRQGSRSGNYWSPPEEPDPDNGQAVEEAMEQCQELLDRSVRMCLRSDVPMGLVISGGIDSPLVAESAVRQGDADTAFFGDVEEETYSEYGAVEVIVDRLGVRLERIMVTADALKDFLKLAEHADDPIGDNSLLPVWVVAEAMAKTHKVCLGGDAGDHIFGGFATLRATKLHANVVCRLPMFLRKMLAFGSSWIPISEKKVTFTYKLWRFLRAFGLSTGQAHFSWNGSWLPDGAAELIRPGPEREVVRGAMAALAERMGLDQGYQLLRLQRADLAEHLTNGIIAKVDRMNMAHGVEVRAPYLDYRLVEWGLRLPDRLKIGPKNELKTLLRAMSRRLYGRIVADQPKQGFSIPTHRWIRGPLRDVVQDLLSPASVERTGVLEPSRVQAALDAHLSGRRSYGFEIWGLALLMAWHRARIERPPDPPPEYPLIERRFEEVGHE